MGSDVRSRGSGDYVRFIILSGARTGSNMLASSLNSSPEIICFRELFNFTAKRFIDFNVDGYDRFSADDRDLRNQDYRRFLRERIFCPHSEDIQAVGFKMPYDHFWGYEDLLPWLADDEQLRVVHLERRNILRTFVSFRIARSTQHWVSDIRPRSSQKAALHRILSELRRPVRTARRLLRPKEPAVRGSRPTLVLSPEECRFFFRKVEWDANYYGNLFARHPTHSICYEDIVEQRDATHASLQQFLNVEPRPLAELTRHQNPQPLAELIENYDELRAAFRETQHRWMFEEE